MSRRSKAVSRHRIQQFLEILGLCFLIGLVGWNFNHGNWAFLGVAFHPYLGVLLAVASLRRSSQSSITVACLVGTLLYLAGMGLTGLAPTLKTVGPVVALLFTGTVLGIAQRAGDRKMSTFRFHLSQISRERIRLRSDLAVLELANEALCDRVQAESKTPHSLSDVARGLSLLEENDLYPAACDAVCDLLNAEAVSLYLLDQDRLVETACTRRSQEPFPDALDDHVLLRLALLRGVPVTALDLELKSGQGKKVSRRRHLMCAPLYHPCGEPLGVLCVDRILFARFNNATKRSLGVLAKFTAEAAANARHLLHSRKVAAAENLAC